MTENERGTSALHQPNGQFAHGNAGRPRGTRNKVSAVALEAVREMAPAALAALRERIAVGDMQAIAFALERTLPRGRTVELDGVTADEVADALASGEITTTEAKDIATALAKLRELTDLDQIAARLDELEKLVGGVR